MNSVLSCARGPSPSISSIRIYIVGPADFVNIKSMRKFKLWPYIILDPKLLCWIAFAPCLWVFWFVRAMTSGSTTHSCGCWAALEVEALVCDLVHDQALKNHSQWLTLKVQRFICQCTYVLNIGPLPPSKGYGPLLKSLSVIFVCLVKQLESLLEGHKQAEWLH